MALKTWVAGEQALAADLIAEFAKVSAGYFPATAGENVTAAKPGYLRTSDNKIYTAHGYKAIGNATLDSGATANDVMKSFVRLNDTQFLTLGRSSNTLTVYVCNKDTGAIVSSSTVSTACRSGDSANSPYHAVARMSDTTFIVFYASSTGNNALRYRTASISGATITMGTDAAYPTGTKDYAKAFSACNANADGKVILGLEHSDSDSSGTHNMSLLYLTVASNSVTETAITTNTEVSAGFNITTNWIKVAITATNVAYIVYCFSGPGDQLGWEYGYYDITAASGATGKSWWPQLSGAGYSDILSTPIKTKPDLVGGYDAVFTGYYTSNTTSNLTFCNIHKFKYNSERCITLNARQSFRNDPGSGNIKMYGNENGIVLYVSSIGNGMYMQFVNGTEVFRNFPSATALSPDNNGWSFMASADVYVIYNGSSVYTGYLPTPCHGIIDATVSAAAATALKEGYNSNFSGLSANREYYLKDTFSSAGDLDYVGTVPIGRALSTTSILIYRGY